MVKASEPRRRTADDVKALTDEERRTRALEDIAGSLRSIRATFIDIGIWVAHIGRNTPTSRKN